MPRKQTTPAAEAMTIDMIDTGPAVTPLSLEPVQQHNAPALQGSTELTVAPLTGPIAQAMQWMRQGGTLAELREILVLQKEHEAYEASKLFNIAFAAFKAEAMPIVRSKTVTDGPLQGKKYEDLYDVVSIVSPLLSKHGLTLAWSTTKDEPEWIEVTSVLKHVAGHSERVSMGGPPDKGGAKNAIQARASTTTYLQRYTSKAILGVAAKGDDTDGNVQDDAPVIDPELLQRARDASLGGWKSLAAFTKKLTEKQRMELDPESDRLKKAAIAADQPPGVKQ